jgi:hypothetical protein
VARPIDAQAGLRTDAPCHPAGSDQPTRLRRWALTRTREALRRGAAGPAANTFRQEAIARLCQVMSYDGWCWTTADPATLLPAGSLAQTTALAARQHGFFELESLTPDVKKHTALVRSASPGGILSVATRGDLARSPRWAELLGPEGIGDELRVALVQGGA